MYNDPYQPSEPQGQPPNPSYPGLPSQPSYPPYEQNGPYYPAPPGTQGYYAPPPGGVPPVPPVPPVMPMYMPPPKKKGSLTWLWITLSIVGCVLIIGCAGCGFFVYNATQQAGKIIGPAFAVGEYYQYLKMDDFSKAYTLVDPNATFTVNGQTVSVQDEQSFAQAVQSVETANGPISAFVAGASATDTTHIPVTVTRRGTSYSVQLTLQQEGKAWKIVSADGI